MNRKQKKPANKKTIKPGFRSEELESLNRKIDALVLKTDAVTIEHEAFKLHLESLKSIYDHFLHEIHGLKTGIESIKDFIGHSKIYHESTNRIDEPLKTNIESSKLKYEQFKSNSESSMTNIESSWLKDGQKKNNNELLMSKCESSSSNFGSSGLIGEPKEFNPESTQITIETLNRIRETVDAAFPGEFYYEYVPKRLVRILTLIREKGKYTAGGLGSSCGVSRQTIQRDVKMLRDAGWITFRGSKNNGYYMLTEKGTSLFI